MAPAQCFPPGLNQGASFLPDVSTVSLNYLIGPSAALEFKSVCVIIAAFETGSCTQRQVAASGEELVQGGLCWVATLLG